MNPAAVTHIKRGGYKAFPAGEFEATSRNARGNKADIYVRYVGGAA